MTSKHTKLFLGCISGTSVDGLDIALIAVTDSGNIEIRAAETTPLPDQLRQSLLLLGQPENDDLDLLGRSDSELGRFTGEALKSFATRCDLTAADITAIGTHGQTVRHRPPENAQDIGFTLQIGDPNHIAEITGIQTIADFRRRDMAAGGHGAPLVPPFHQALFGNLPGNVAVLNVGGISNVSLLGSPPSGFDTGPGNALMDSWCVQHLGVAYDEDGQWAASGEVHPVLLARCFEDPYFGMSPPKSTGREYFNLGWLEQQLQGREIAAADVQATLCELTALCTVKALEQHSPDTSEIIVCGGGRLNGHLMDRLKHHSRAQVVASEQYKVDGDSIEAALFGWLAWSTLAGQPGNEPAVSGAAGYRILGGIYPA